MEKWRHPFESDGSDAEIERLAATITVGLTTTAIMTRFYRSVSFDEGEDIAADKKELIELSGWLVWCIVGRVMAEANNHQVSTACP